ncbi:hypothetical protein NM688_g6743 [Phlebia brevispora]|uniref:Uncharacterized protein n=1 Tax=Phlebia brevispora TaxID=194682 RepID=A0ACC1SCU6_9APHY|nr:hypothetical protein NM688_g6743 [Phlebia brevispora]
MQWNQVPYAPTEGRQANVPQAPHRYAIHPVSSAPPAFFPPAPYTSAVSNFPDQNIQPQVASQMAPWISTSPFRNGPVQSSGFAEDVTKDQAARQEQRLMDQGFVPVPPQFRTTWPQRTILFRTRFDNAINVAHFTGDGGERGLYGSNLAGAMTPAFGVTTRITYRMHWPGYVYKDYPIDVEPSTTVYFLARTISCLVLKYFREQVIQRDAWGNEVNDQWTTENGRSSTQGGVLTKQIWFDSLVYCPGENCYMSRFYLRA